MRLHPTSGRSMRHAAPIPEAIKAAAASRFMSGLMSGPDVRRWLWSEYGYSVSPDAVRDWARARGWSG